MTVTPSQLGRPVGANGEQTRARIIAAAMRCVAELGYSQATIREIARAAEMTSGSLYHYFPNKSELLKATVREIEEIAFPRLRAAAARADDVVDRLEAVMDESDRALESNDVPEESPTALRYHIELLHPLEPGHRYAVLVDAQSGATFDDGSGKEIPEQRLEFRTGGERETPKAPPKKKRRHH